MPVMAICLKKFGYGLTGRSGQQLLDIVDVLREVARQEPDYAEELVIMSVELEALVRPAKPTVFNDGDMLLEFVEDEPITKLA